VTLIRRLRWRLDALWRRLRGWPEWCYCKNHDRFTGVCIVCEMPVFTPEDCTWISGYLCREHYGKWNPWDDEEPVNQAWAAYSR
jgi:hypothetical protein